MEEMSHILVKQKNKEAVAQLYNRYGKKLCSYAVYKWNIDTDEAWELVYKTIYRVLDQADKYTFESEEKFASFVFRVFINYIKNHIRDHVSKQPEIDSLTNMKDVAVNEENISKPTKVINILSQELDKLEDWQRILLLLRAQEVPYAEIAKLINKPEEQLKVYHQRLRKQITEKLLLRINQSNPSHNANV